LRALMHMVMNLWVPKKTLSFSTRCAYYYFIKKDSTPWSLVVIAILHHDCCSSTLTTIQICNCEINVVIAVDNSCMLECFALISGRVHLEARELL
jgi:hypothetical protein